MNLTCNNECKVLVRYRKLFLNLFFKKSWNFFRNSKKTNSSSLAAAVVKFSTRPIMEIVYFLKQNKWQKIEVSATSQLFNKIYRWCPCFGKLTFPEVTWNTWEKMEWKNSRDKSNLHRVLEDSSSCNHQLRARPFPARAPQSPTRSTMSWAPPLSIMPSQPAAHPTQLQLIHSWA